MFNENPVNGGAVREADRSASRTKKKNTQKRRKFFFAWGAGKKTRT